MIYTVWRDRAGAVLTPAEGEGPPRFADGTPDKTCAEVVGRFEADSWEAACAELHRPVGREPYRPAAPGGGGRG